MKEQEFKPLWVSYNNMDIAEQRTALKALWDLTDQLKDIVVNLEHENETLKKQLETLRRSGNTEGNDMIKEYLNRKQ